MCFLNVVHAEDLQGDKEGRFMSVVEREAEWKEVS
jgi:hypothetical protein